MVVSTGSQERLQNYATMSQYQAILLPYHKQVIEQYNTFVKRLIPDDSSILRAQRETQTDALTQFVDRVGGKELGRKYNPLSTQPKIMLSEYCEEGRPVAHTGALVTALQQLPTDIAERTALMRDVMRMHIARFYESIKDFRGADVNLSNGQESSTLLERILGEIEQFDAESVGAYYRGIQKIRQSTNSSDIDSFAHEAMQEIRDSHIDSNQRDVLEQRIGAFAKGKRDTIKGYSLHTMQRDRAVIEKKIAEGKMGEIQFLQHLQDAWEGIQYFTPDQQKSFLLSHIPKPILMGLVGLKSARRVLSRRMVTADLVARYGWQLRVGRADELVRTFEQFASIANTPDFTRFQKRMSDEYLQTEASGFEVSENIKLQENVSPQALLRESMYALLKIHRPRGQEQVRFTVFYGEGKIQKISISTHEDITSGELERNITAALEAAPPIADITNPDGSTVSFQERAELGYKRYSISREKDALYNYIYKHKEDPDNPNSKDVVGDYIIQMKDHSRAVLHDTDFVDEHSPETVFAVDDHQAALLIDSRAKLLQKTPISRVVIRYRHSAIDGTQAYEHSQKIFESLRRLTSDRYTELNGDLYSDLTTYLESLMPPDGIGVPQIEGHSQYREVKEAYPSLQIPYTNEKGEATTSKLSPAFTRSFIYALANDVDVFHYLHASGKGKDIFFDERGDRFDSLQPIYTSFNHLREEFKKWREGSSVNGDNVQEWLRQYGRLKTSAEQKYCDVFTFAAAPPGKLEAAFAKVSGPLHGGTKILAAPEGGMYSGLPPQEVSSAYAAAPEAEKPILETTFQTAQASSYNQIPIDLLNARSSMGVIGYLQRGGIAISTCRKLPCQAQNTFRREFLALRPDISKKEEKQYLQQFNPLLVKWDGLLKGQNTLADYLEIRKQLFNTLMNEGNETGIFLRTQVGVTDEVTFQIYLDSILQKSAEDTFNREQIQATKKDFIEFMEQSGVSVRMKLNKK